MAATPRRRAEERKSAPRRTVRGRLVVVVAASVGAAVIAGSGVSAWRDSGRDAAQQADRLRATAAVMGSTAADALVRNDIAQARQRVSAIAGLPGVVYARLDRADGTALVQLGDGRGVSARVAAPIFANGRRVGQLVLAGRSAGALGRALQSLGASLIAALLALGVGFAVAWRTEQEITAPVTALNRALTRLRAGQGFDAAVAAGGADDEIGELVHGFNRLMGDLRDQEAVTASHLVGLQGELRQAQAAASAAERAKAEALATVGHDLRAPVSGVAAMAEMLAAGELPLRQRRFAEAIARSGSSLLATIEDVLDVARIEAGKVELKAAPVDMAELVEDVCTLFWEPASAKGLDLAAYVDPEVPARVAADPVRLRQVLDALVNNAVKFTETGGVLIEVEAETGGVLRISVHDTGAGIPKDRLNHVFGGFAPGESGGAGTGSGLGLAVCRRLVEAMGGRFLVNSTVGRGSSFIFRLPVQALEAAAPWPGAQRANARAHLPVHGLSSRRALSRYLAKAGYALTAVADEPAALRIGDADCLQKAAPDAIPTIALAAYGESAPYEMRRDGRAQAVLARPVRREELAVLLRQAQRGEPLSDPQIALSIGAADELPLFAGARVLVADDSAVNREVAQERLRRLGAEPRLVGDGRQAVQAVLAETFDLILMDEDMAGVDGYAAAREIRLREADMGRSPAPILGLSRHPAGARGAWRDVGVDAVLQQPFTLAELAAALARFLSPTPRAAPATVAPPALAPVVIGEGGLIDGQVAAQLEAIAASGRAEFVSRVYSLYRENAPDSVLKLMDAAAQDDAAACAKAAHALKSMSFNIGATAVATLAGDIELSAREGETPSPTSIAELQNLLSATLSRLSGGVEPVAAAHALSIPGADAELLAEMERGLAEDQMSLVYQPQVDRDGERVIGVEALIRWTHPSKGPISPAVFIPVAERYGLIPRITDWVVERMLAETRYLTGLQVSFNVSAIEFSEPGFVDRLLSQIGRNGYDPRRLEVEITETAILQNEGAVRRNIDQLRAAGMRIALDDFGAGYSSLGHLRRYPFDKLKIDREFITDCSRDMQAATVVHAVVSIGRALGMKVIAEGVETDTQRKFLKVAGVYAMQGYLFGKPVSVDELAFSLSRKPRLERA
jgi:two-component system sensor histidine kinase BarA